MILAPTFGPIGIQSAGAVASMINKHSAAVAIGDVVITSFSHTSAVYPPASSDPQSITNLRLSPFSCIKLAEGDVNTSNCGYIGSVVGLGSASGAVGTEVLVQFGGVVKAKVFCNTADTIDIGNRLFLSDTAGRFGSAADSATPDTTVAIALESVAANTSAIINVLLFNGPIDGTVTAAS